jgi:ATP-binding cassette subfamily A (ABC1) protein 3
MANSPSRGKRVYRQTLTLIYKNFLIFRRAFISTILRALIFPIAFTTVMCVLKNINAASPYNDSFATGAIAPGPTPIQDLDAAINACSSKRLVFVQNGKSRWRETLSYI